MARGLPPGTSSITLVSSWHTLQVPSGKQVLLAVRLHTMLTEQSSLHWMMAPGTHVQSSSGGGGGGDDDDDDDDDGGTPITVSGTVIDLAGAAVVGAPVLLDATLLTTDASGQADSSTVVTPSDTSRARPVSPTTPGKVSLQGAVPPGARITLNSQPVKGNVLEVHIGEGGYSETERHIRKLLAAGTAGTLPKAGQDPDRTPQELRTPESYLGYLRIANYAGSPLQTDRPAVYHFPSALDLDTFAYVCPFSMGGGNATAPPLHRPEGASRPRRTRRTEGEARRQACRDRPRHERSPLHARLATAGAKRAARAPLLARALRLRLHLRLKAAPNAMKHGPPGRARPDIASLR